MLLKINTTSGYKAFSSEGEGFTHINAYSAAESLIGRMLSNWYHAPFTHPLYGEFNTLEGLWFYLSRGVYDYYRTCSGRQAKQYGRGKKRKRIQGFRKQILIGAKHKLMDNMNIAYLLTEFKDIPIGHYYQYNNKINDQYKRDAWLWQYYARFAKLND